jgi:hypothetical protein
MADRTGDASDLPVREVGTYAAFTEMSKNDLLQPELDKIFADHYAAAGTSDQTHSQPLEPPSGHSERYTPAQRTQLLLMWDKALTVEELYQLRTNGTLPNTPGPGPDRMQQLHAAFWKLYQEAYALDPVFWGAERHPDSAGVKKRVQRAAKKCLCKLVKEHTVGDLLRRQPGLAREQRTPQLIECINLVLAGRHDQHGVRPYVDIEHLRDACPRFQELMLEMHLTHLAYVWKEMQAVCWLTRHLRLDKYRIYYCKKRKCPEVHQKAGEATGKLPRTFHKGCAAALACNVRVHRDTCLLALLASSLVYQTGSCALPVTRAPRVCSYADLDTPDWLNYDCLYDPEQPLYWNLDWIDDMVQVDATTVDVDKMYSSTGIWAHGMALPEVSQHHKPGAVKAWPQVMVYSLTNKDIGVRLFCIHTGMMLWHDASRQTEWHQICGSEVQLIAAA